MQQSNKNLNAQQLQIYTGGNRTLKQATLVILIALIITTCGCQPQTDNQAGTTPKHLTVGYIDTDQLLVKWDKYKEFGDKYIAERNKLVESIAEKSNQGKNVSDESKAQAQALIAEFDSKWDVQREKVVEEIRESSQAVAKEQNIDVVIDNSATNPIIEYGGTDLTLSVLKKLKEQQK